MQTEYEATYTNIDKEDVRKRLAEAGAKLLKQEFLQKRCVFNLPTGHEIPGGWLRVRDEGDKITMSLKIVDGKEISNQKEICLTINNFDDAVQMLEMTGCERKAYQENRRELWILDDVEITIDEWPFLEPFIEVEGKSEQAVKDVSKKLKFDYNSAFFGAVGTLYERKYAVPEYDVNNNTPRIVFDMPNPFLDDK